jgi:hypothetical protein
MSIDLRTLARQTIQSWSFKGPEKDDTKGSMDTIVSLSRNMASDVMALVL